MFAKRFAKCLELRSKKPIDVAIGCKVSKSCVSQYMHGVRTPKRQTIEKFASYLNVNPLYLMGLSNDIIALHIEVKPDEALDGTDEVRNALTNELLNISSKCNVEKLNQLVKLARTFIDE